MPAVDPLFSTLERSSLKAQDWTGCELPSTLNGFRVSFAIKWKTGLRFRVLGQAPSSETWVL